jgi:putative sterol carrier protein
METPQTAKEFFESLPDRIPPEQTAGVTNSYVFEIKDAGTWHVGVEDGKIVVREGDGEADARFTMSDETFQKLVTGKQNPAVAVFTRKIKISGDMAAAAKLKTLLG